MPKLRDVAVDLTPLRESGQYRLLWFGLSVSAIGSQISHVAVPFQVYEITHSTLAVGLLGLFAMFPLLVLSIVGGAVADHVDRRRLVIVCEVGGAACAGLLALNATLPHPHLWAIYLLATLNTSFYALGTPSRRSAAPLLLPAHLITSAAALTSVSYSISWLIGPAVGGVLIALWGPVWTYTIDAASFVMCMTMVAAMRPIPPVVGEDETLGFQTVVEGLRYLRGKGALLGSFAMDLNAMIFGMPLALFPAVVDERFHGNANVLGLLYSAPFAGTLIASATSGWAKHVHRHGRAVCLAVAAWGLAITAFGFARALWLSLLMLVVAGASDMVSGIFRQSILQRASPPKMLGRMEGVGMAVWTTGPALGDMEAGGVAALTTVDTSIVLGGLACVVGVGALALLLPAFARYDVDDEAVVVVVGSDEGEPSADTASDAAAELRFSPST